MNRLRDWELWDAIAKLEKRAAFRDGEHGQKVKVEREKTRDPAALQLLGQMLQGQGNGNGALDPVEMDARAARHFRKKDQEGD